MHHFWLLTLSSTIFFKFLDALWASQLNLKLCCKQYSNKFVLHLIVAPQLSSGWRQLLNQNKAGRLGQWVVYVSSYVCGVHPVGFIDTKILFQLYKISEIRAIHCQWNPLVGNHTPTLFCRLIYTDVFATKIWNVFCYLIPFSNSPKINLWYSTLSFKI